MTPRPPLLWKPNIYHFVAAAGGRVGAVSPAIGRRVTTEAWRGVVRRTILEDRHANADAREGAWELDSFFNEARR